jgi:hypothetical protein
MAARVDTITVTFGDRAENHAGMQQLGTAASVGLTYGDLYCAAQKFRRQGCECQLLNLITEAGVELLGDEGGPEPAYLLIVRKGVDALLATGLGLSEERHEALAAAPLEPDGARHHADIMLVEQRQLDFDKKALFRGEVKNSLARWNLCFAAGAQEPNYETGKGRTIAFADVEYTRAAREALPHYFGEKTRELVAEGNYYYDAKKCGIGFHGDKERKIVVALRLGVAIPLHFQWFHRHESQGQRIALTLNHGDLYAMSEKAVGADWKMSSIPTLRHAAGALKYLTAKK